MQMEKVMNDEYGILEPTQKLGHVKAMNPTNKSAE